MRTRRISALALLACVCLAASASATQKVKLTVAFVPNHPGQRTTIEFAFAISGAAGSVPSPVTNLDLRLPAHMGIATTTLGQANCNSADLIEGGLHGCSANARIGYGDAVAVVPFGPQRVREKVSINALEGPPATGESLDVLFYAEGLSPVYAQLVFPGIVLNDTSPFGERINTLIPLLSAWPEGPDVALESFRSTIGPLHLTYHRQVNGKTISYHPHGVSVPRVCPPGGYPFAAELDFQDGTHAIGSYSVPCPRA
jgi:hypothetical protein